jgi:hypothetical protein
MNVSLAGLADFQAGAGLVTGQFFYNIVQGANTIFYVRYYRLQAGALVPVNFPDVEYGVRVEIAF